MANIKVVLEYDGTDFHGWQVQPRLRTIQGELQRAVRLVSGVKTTVTGAGRTDSGVHARAQVANFKTNVSMKTTDWVRALNHYLPEDVAILSASRVHERFNSRYSATGKVYEYRILNVRTLHPLRRNFIWNIFQTLDIRRMRTAARFLVGRHDFSSFRVGPHIRKNRNFRSDSMCHIQSLKIRQSGEEIVFFIQGNRFLQQMVRTIVGTLVEIGRGKISPIEIREIIKKKDRRFAGPTAPARGLCLEKVSYRK